MKARLSAYDEVTGKPRRDPLAWRLKKNMKSNKNLIMSKYSSAVPSKESTTALHKGSKTILSERSKQGITQPSNQQDGACLPATMNKDILPEVTQELAKSDENISKAQGATEEQEDLKQEAHLNIMSKRSSLSTFVERKKSNSNRGSME